MVDQSRAGWGWSAPAQQKYIYLLPHHHRHAWTHLWPGLDDDENGSGAVRSTSGMMLIVPPPSDEAGRKGRLPLPAPAPVAAAAADPSPHIAHTFNVMK